MTHINSYGTLTYKRYDLTPARRPDFIIINKKKKRIAKLSTLLSGGPQNKYEGMLKEG